MPERKEISYSVQKQPLPSILIADCGHKLLQMRFLIYFPFPSKLWFHEAFAEQAEKQETWLWAVSSSSFLSTALAFPWLALLASCSPGLWLSGWSWSHVSWVSNFDSGQWICGNFRLMGYTTAALIGVWGLKTLCHRRWEIHTPWRQPHGHSLWLELSWYLQH